MPKIFWAYQAPSTANENPDDPMLSIGGTGPIDIMPLDDFLPQLLFITVKYRQVPCKLPTSIRLSSEEGEILVKSLYQNAEDILEALELINTNKNFYQIKDTISSLDTSCPFKCSQEIIFRMPFQVLRENETLEIGHDPILYGGKAHWNPTLCQQYFFQAQDPGGYISISTLSSRDYPTDTFYPSLAHLIEGQKLTIPLTFSNENYSYRSFSYKIIDEKELSICFVR
jgi:hypothetical protein